MYYYELHESDDDLYTDALLAHEQEFTEEEFLELVLEAREAVVRSFEEDSLVEAIANELERRHEFVFIDDARLVASVNVSLVDRDNILATVDAGGSRHHEDDEEDDGDDDEDDEDDRAEDAAEFRTLVVDIDREDLN